MDYNFIYEALLVLMTGAITFFLVPVLKNQGIYFWVLTAVKAAEEVYKEVEKSGLIKEGFVRDFLKAKHIPISEETLILFIKRAVTELRKG